jgi:NAD(P)-dependent dehydrogenase (short-subunit alcohol dehydrogenase family)
LPVSPVIIVTGAGSGVGRATCEHLAASAARLVLVGRSESNLRETSRILHEHNPQAPKPLILAADISDQRKCQQIVAAAAQKWSRVDALINNAGTVTMSPIDVIDERTMQEMFAVNAFGPAYFIAACWPHFVRQRGGRVVNVSSMSTIDPFPGLAMYAASKAALESLTRSIMNEGRTHNILGFTIVLGAVETAMLRSVASEHDLPSSHVLEPRAAARIIAECARGDRDVDAGKPLIVKKQ